MTIVIVSGGIDLSVGSILSFTSVLAVTLAGHGLAAIVVPTWPAASSAWSTG